MRDHIGVLVLVALIAGIGMGCAGSIGKKGLQISTGIATADASGEVTSQGFSEGGVEVVKEAIAVAGGLLEALLRIPLSALGGLAEGAVEPLDSVGVDARATTVSEQGNEDALIHQW